MKAVAERAKVIVDGADTFLCLSVPYRDARKIVSGMETGKQYTVEVKPYRDRRSLDQNALAWELIGKLSAALRIPPEKVYREAVRDIGGNYEVMPVRDDAAETWKAVWTGRGLGWLCEEIGPSKFEGYTNFRCFYGSSVYDKEQFSRLIDNLMQECEEAGIDV